MMEITNVEDKTIMWVDLGFNIAAWVIWIILMIAGCICFVCARNNDAKLHKEIKKAKKKLKAKIAGMRPDESQMMMNQGIPVGHVQTGIQMHPQNPYPDGPNTASKLN